MIMSDNFKKAVYLHSSGDLKNAKNVYEDLIEQDPRDVSSIFNLGLLYFQINDMDRAEIYLKRAVDSEQRPDFYFALGNTLRAKGNIDESIEAYLKAVALKPDYTDAWHEIIHNKKVTKDDKETLNSIISILNSSQCTEHQATKCHFALCKAYNDLEQYKKAFSHYKTGNELKEKDSPFDPLTFKLYASKLINTK